jgi:hypothetical protein
VKYVMAFTGRKGPSLLDDGSTRETVATECRQAALEFMTGTASGWDKLDLAMWLTGAYARATRHAIHGERVASLNGQKEVQPEAIEDLVGRVRSQLVASLERAAISDGALDFAEEMVERGYVRRAIDLDGIDVWIPVDAARMRLRERVRALFAADYLNEPAAYADLFVCHRCEGIVFDEDAKRLNFCPLHRSVSGIVPKKPEADEEQEAAASGDE